MAGKKSAAALAAPTPGAKFVSRRSIDPGTFETNWVSVSFIGNALKY